MNKLNMNSNSATEHARILQERLKSLEEDLDHMRNQRNEFQEDARQAKQANEILEKELIVYRTKSIKAEGD